MPANTYKQLSHYFKKIKDFKSVTTPADGWVRSVRDSLGMSRRQLAGRLGVSVSRIQRLEHDEVTGSVTMKTMMRTAEAVDCVFVYAVIPKTSINDSLQKQGIKKSMQQLGLIENTEIERDEANADLLSALADQMIDKSKRTLWDE
ncbi:MAG: mobile mystery protein A [Cocleimonas sp.]